MSCPNFVSCVTPSLYAGTEIGFIRETCLGDWSVCVKRRSYHNQQGILPDLDIWKAYLREEPGPCSRLPFCCAKILGRPVKEYEVSACTNENHIYCVFYYTWDRSGRDPEDPMTNAVRHGDPIEDQVMNRLLGKE